MGQIGYSLESGDHIAWFGDGSQAQVITRRKVFDPELQSYVHQFVLNPSNEIRETYQLDPDVDLDANGWIFREFDSKEVTILMMRGGKSRTFIETDVNGKDTPMSMKLTEWKELCRSYEQKMKVLKGAANRRLADLHTIQTQMTEYMRHQGDMVQEVKRMGGYKTADQIMQEQMAGGPDEEVQQ